MAKFREQPNPSSLPAESVNNLTPEQFMALRKSMRPVPGNGAGLRALAVSKLAKEELDHFEQLGLPIEEIQKHGEVPVDLIQRLQELQKQAKNNPVNSAIVNFQNAQQQNDPLRRFSKDFKVKQNTVSIDQLPPDKQKEYLDILEQTRAFYRDRETKSNARNIQLDPGAAAGFYQAQEAAKAAGNGPFVPPKGSYEKPQPKQPGQGLEIELDFENIKSVEPPKVDKPESPKQETQAPTVDTGVRDAVSIEQSMKPCVCCGWYPGVELPEPTEQDQENFVIAIMGDKPFAKEFKLFSGRIRVVFRSLTARESDICYNQALIDARKGRIGDSPIDITSAVSRYRMVLQLLQLTSVEKPVEFCESLKDWLTALNFNPDAAGVGETGLREIYQALVYDDDAPLRNEALLIALNNVWQHFYRLEMKLRGTAYNPLS